MGHYWVSDTTGNLDTEEAELGHPETELVRLLKMGI